MKTRIIHVSIFMCMVLSVPGCAPVIVGGAATTVASSAAEERGITGVWDDTKIKTQILWHYRQLDKGPSGDIEVVVRQGCVLLTGSVDQPEAKVEAVRLAWKVPGVREVKDEITIGKSETITSFANDSWITTKIKSTLLFDKDVHSVNYNVQTINGVVYVMGVSPNERELNKVLDRVRRVPGVKEVVNYVEVGKKDVKKVDNKQNRK